MDPIENLGDWQLGLIVAARTGAVIGPGCRAGGGPPGASRPAGLWRTLHAPYGVLGLRHEVNEDLRGLVCGEHLENANPRD